MKNCKGSKNPRNPSSFLVCTEVFELGPSLYVVELKKSHGDSTLYRQVPMHNRTLPPLFFRKPNATISAMRHLSHCSSEKPNATISAMQHLSAIVL
uniref:Uncharacterized protein n=1 Tax=Arundo donax TaxID=35708 RepID=A0A0A9EFZ1_ARUDO